MHIVSLDLVQICPEYSLKFYLRRLSLDSISMTVVVVNVSFWSVEHLPHDAPEVSSWYGKPFQKYCWCALLTPLWHPFHLNTLSFISCCNGSSSWSSLVATVALVVVLVKVAVVVVACTYYLFVNWSSPFSILWKFQLDAVIHSGDTPFWQSACT